MSVYADQSHKNNALRELQKQVAVQATGDSDHCAVLHVIADELRRILDTPVAYEPGDNTADLSVTVSWPLRKGEMQTAVFDRDGGPDLETLTKLDVIILQRMLYHALGCLP